MPSGQRTLTEDLVDLVTSGPEAAGISNRDTSVVVHELFLAPNNRSWLQDMPSIKATAFFRLWPTGWTNCPNLKVRMFLDIQRGQGDTSAHREIIRRFADRFRNTQWPRGSKAYLSVL